MELTRLEAAVLEAQYLLGGASMHHVGRALRGTYTSVEVTDAMYRMRHVNGHGWDKPLVGWSQRENEPRLNGRPYGITAHGVRALREHAKRWGAEGGLTVPQVFEWRREAVRVGFENLPSMAKPL